MQLIEQGQHNWTQGLREREKTTLAVDRARTAQLDTRAKREAKTTLAVDRARAAQLDTRAKREREDNPCS